MVKNPPTNAGDPRDAGSIPGSGRSWRRKWQPIPVFLPRKFQAQRSLVGYSPKGHKASDMTERLSTHRQNYRVWTGEQHLETQGGGLSRAGDQVNVLEAGKLGMIHWCTSCPGLGADLAFLSAPYLRLGTDWWTREGGQCRGNWEEECLQQPKSVLAEWGLDANFKHPLRHSLRQDFIIYQHLSSEQVLGRRPPMCNTFLCPPIWTLKNQTVFTRNPGQWLFQVAGKHYASHFLFPLCGWTMMS